MTRIHVPSGRKIEPRTVTFNRSSFVWTLIATSLLIGLSLTMAYSYGLERWIETTERAMDNADHWMAQAKTCQVRAERTAQETARAQQGVYEMLATWRAYSGRRVEVEVETEVDDR